MALSQDAMNIAKNSDFQNRIRYHLTTAAINVMAEGTGVANHNTRILYADKILEGNADYYSATIAVLTNGTIAGSINMSQPDFGIPDNDLPFTVNSLFDALAGV